MAQSARTDAEASVALEPSAPIRSAPAKAAYLAGGIGGLMAFGFWVLQPILVFLVVGDAGEDIWGTAEYFQTVPWNGLYEVIAFGGIGLGVALVVVSTGLIVRRRVPEPTATGTLGTALGVVAAAAWLFAAGLAYAPYTSVGYYVPEFVPEIADQKATFEALGLTAVAVLIVFCLATAGWLIAFGISGRRAGVIGWPLAVLGWLAAAVAISAFFMPFAPPWGMIAPLAYLPVLGIALLVKSRRA